MTLFPKTKPYDGPRLNNLKDFPDYDFLTETNEVVSWRCRRPRIIRGTPNARGTCRHFSLWCPRINTYAVVSTGKLRKAAGTRRHYSKRVRHTIGSVWRTASKLGLKKSPEFLAQWGHLVASTEGARANRFAKGQSPANKGKRIEEFMSEEGIKRSSRTRFKAGHRPHNQRDIGTECVHGDGYVYLRIESGCVLKHRYVWEQANGEVPEGYVVAFRDGNRQNCDLTNLYLLSRADNARRRVSEETPEARKARLAKAQTSRNKSIRRDKLRLHWGMEPLGKLVKRW